MRVNHSHVIQWLNGRVCVCGPEVAGWENDLTIAFRRSSYNSHLRYTRLPFVRLMSIERILTVKLYTGRLYARSLTVD